MKNSNTIFNVDNTLETDLIKIPSMLIQPFIENAIVHGITPKKEGGEIEIHISLFSPKILKCSIEDNGIGRKKGKKETISISWNKYSFKKINFIIK